GAIDLAKSAHESLVERRGRSPTKLPRIAAAPPRPSLREDRRAHSPPPMAEPGPTGGASPSSAQPPTDEPEELEAAPTPRLAKNRAESHFQLKLLDEEIARAKPGNGPSPVDAQRLASEARASYERGDYTEALRQALRGRRLVGGRLETLPATKVAWNPASPPAVPAPSASAPPNPPKGPVAGECAKCGRARGASDRFCRGCGSPFGRDRCPGCGAAAEPTDAFCGRCGAAINAPGTP
ncbi:MAG: zinc ribbon domain-containing protein, partial [Thermoplasmata archaeon]|nr:zinc ribbon domain-containing protein [Thermoplasmata archaeon]